MPDALRKPRGLALLALNVVLLGMLLGLIVAPPRAQLPPAQPLDLSGLLANQAAPPSAAASLGDTYALLISQPLFHQDRKYTAPAIAEAVAVSPPPDFVLTGYLDIPGRPAKAFLRERSGTRSLTVGVGDSVDGWPVVSITPKQVSLRQGERTAELSRGGVTAVVTSAGAIAAEPGLSPGVTAANASAPAPVPVTAGLRGEAPVRDPALSPTRPSDRADLAAPVSVPPGSRLSVSPVQVTHTASLSGVTVTGKRLAPEEAPADLGPPLIVSPQGSPQTYRQQPPKPSD